MSNKKEFLAESTLDGSGSEKQVASMKNTQNQYNKDEIDFVPFKAANFKNWSYVPLFTSLFNIKRYRDQLSNNAIIVYSFLYSRLSWLRTLEDPNTIDESGELFIIMETEEVKEILGVSNTTAVKVMKELRAAKLIRASERETKFIRGIGVRRAPNRNYLGKIVQRDDDIFLNSKWDRIGKKRELAAFRDDEILKNRISFRKNSSEVLENRIKHEISISNEDIENRTSQNTNDDSEALKNRMKLLSTIKDTNKDTIKDTIKGLSTEQLELNIFLKTYRREFITERTVQMLQPFGEISIIQKYLDAIFEAKKKVENYRSKEDRKLGLSSERTFIVGEMFSKALELSVGHIMLERKMRIAKNNFIDEFDKYFWKSLQNFWKNALLNIDKNYEMLLYQKQLKLPLEADEFENILMSEGYLDMDDSEMYDFVFGRKRDYYLGEKFSDYIQRQYESGHSFTDDELNRMAKKLSSGSSTD